MSVELRPVDVDRWDELVARADDSTPFHLSPALSLLADDGDVQAHRLAGFVGEEPVGLFPLFTREFGPLTVGFSPPPNRKIPYMGPVFMNLEKLKPRRRERRKTEFVDAAIEWLRAEHDPAFVNIRTTPGYHDVRPFIWQSFTATPRYTYLVDLTRGADALLQAFSTDARRNVTADYDVDYRVAVGDESVIEAIHEQVAARHAEQGESFPLDVGFVTALAEALPEGVVQPYYCEVDGEFAGGSINLTFEGRATSWIGNAKPGAEIPVNDILEWHFLQDAIERGVTTYDLAGANNQRLSEYKSKFAPDLATYYTLEHGHWGTRRLAKLYRQLG